MNKHSFDEYAHQQNPSSENGQVSELHESDYESFGKQAHDLGLLLNATTAFASTQTLGDLLNILAREMTASVESAFCRVYLFNPSTQTLASHSTYIIRNLMLDSMIGTVFSIDQLPLHAQVIQRQMPLVVMRAESEKLSACEFDLLFSPGARSALMMPLIVKEKCLGLATLGEMRSWERTPFSESKIELCRAMARQGALAIENIQALEAITAQTQHLNLILNSVADGILQADLEQRIIAFNPAAELITGFHAAEVIGKRCSDVFRSQTEDGRSLCDSHCPHCQLVATGGIAQRTEKEWILRQDGTRILIARTLAPFINLQGQLAGTVSIIRDITREEELLRLKTDFISMVSHQLRNPLASIGLTAELIASEKLDDAHQRDMVSSLNQQCLHLTHLVNQVLQTYHLEQGQSDLVLEPLALAPLIDQTVRLYRTRYNQHRLEINVPEDLAFAYGDRTSTSIILDNLLQNAVNYSPFDSCITISAQEYDQTIVVSVADQGPGIPHDQMAHIFERFHRVKGREKQTSGFGLGLYIAKKLSEAQQGEIWVENLMNHGARFSFALKKLEDK